MTGLGLGEVVHTMADRREDVSGCFATWQGHLPSSGLDVETESWGNPAKPPAPSAGRSLLRRSRGALRLRASGLSCVRVHPRLKALPACLLSGAALAPATMQWRHSRTEAGPPWHATPGNSSVQI